jgi:serine/threonine protein kinase
VHIYLMPAMAGAVFKSKSQPLVSSVGTPAWMAPEVLCAQPYGLKADVYSFGVIVWEALARAVPWAGMTAIQIIAAVGTEKQRLPLPTQSTNGTSNAPSVGTSSVSVHSWLSHLPTSMGELNRCCRSAARCRGSCEFAGRAGQLV